MTRLTLDNVEKRYGELRVLPPITAQLEPGDALGLWGPTGCGKTTLLRIIAGLTEPTAGTVHIAGRLANRPASALPPSKRRVGMVFQDLALWPHMTARRHLEYALGSTRERAGRRERADELLNRVQLTEHARRRPSAMSRGQRQRLAIARALCTDPPVLLLDEPVSSQDSAMGGRMGELFLEHRSEGKALVVASHDSTFLKSLCNRILIFDNDGVRCVDAKDFE